MNEYWPFFVLVAFAAVVYAVTIIWTEYVSPDMEIESSEAETIEKLLVIKAAQILAASRQIERTHEEEKKLHLASSAK